MHKILLDICCDLLKVNSHVEPLQLVRLFLSKHRKSRSWPNDGRGARGLGVGAEATGSGMVRNGWRLRWWAQSILRNVIRIHQTEGGRGGKEEEKEDDGQAGPTSEGQNCRIKMFNLILKSFNFVVWSNLQICKQLRTIKSN